MTRSEDLVRERGGSSGVLSRVLRRARRGRIIAALIAVVGVGLAAGVGIFLWLEAQRPFADYNSTVESVATARLDGRTVVITGDSTGVIRVADLATGDPVGQRIKGDGRGGLTLTTAQLDGRTVIISSGGGMLRVWDLATGTPIGQPLAGHYSQDLATAQLDGRTVVIASAINSVTRVWDLATGTLVRELSGTYGPVATAPLDGRTVIVIGADRGSATLVWDLATGAQVAHYDRIDEPSLAVTSTRLGGRSVVVSDGRSGDGFRVWDLATGDHVSSPLVWPDDGRPTSSADERNVRAVTTAQLDGQNVIITGSDDGMVRVWDLATSTPIGRPLDGHLGTSVDALATAQLDGRTVIISGGGDGTVRVWDLAGVRP